MGEEIALFRDHTGKIGALESYCPHLGANLACGTVKQETLQCPFHGIRFSKDGLSTTKDCEGLRSYQLKSWPAFEKYGLIFLMHNPLDAQFNIQFPEWAFLNWTRPIQYCFKIRSHPQEILENSVDQLHFFQVHKYISVDKIQPLQTTGSEFSIAFHLIRKEGLVKIFRHKTLEFFINIHAYGLGLSTVDIWLPTYGIKAKQIVFPTPIDGEFIYVRTLTSIQIIKNIPFIPKWMTTRFMRNMLSNYINKMLAKGFLKDFLPDLKIWESKKYITNPKPLSNEDDIKKYRAWAVQFYRT